MLKTRVLPCLLLKNGGLVKTIKFKNPKYVGDPINAVKIFNEKEVDELILIDIEASRQNKGPDFKIIERIGKEAFMPMCYGGGIKKISEVKKIFNSGFEKISLNISAIETPELISEIADTYGSQSVIVSIDIKKNFICKYEVYNYLTSKTIKRDPVKFALDAESRGAGELLINSVDREGTMNGYDLNLIKRVADAVNIQVIAIGGAGNIQDFVGAVNNCGISAVAAGSMFVFQGIHRAVLITYPSRDVLEKILK